MRSFSRFLSSPLALVLAVAVGLVAGVVSTRALVDRAAQPVLEEAPTDPILVEVVNTEFGRTVPVAVRVDWSGRPIAAPVLAGVVTAVQDGLVDPKPGDVLLRVDDEPVVVAVGETPAYRDLTSGAEGEDVRQLQEFLVMLGLFEYAPDGEFGTSTAQAVRLLNERHGASFGSTIPLGSLVFLGEDNQHRLSTEIVLGSPAPTSLEFSALDAEGPEFTALIGLLPGLAEGMLVEIEELNHPLRVSTIVREGQEALMALRDKDGAPPCSSPDCPFWNQREPRLIVGGRLELVPGQSGPSVPLGALTLSPEGGAVVVDEQGNQFAVRVLATQDGLALIDGLPSTVTRIRVVKQ